MDVQPGENALFKREGIKLQPSKPYRSQTDVRTRPGPSKGGVNGRALEDDSSQVRPLGFELNHFIFSVRNKR